MSHRYVCPECGPSVTRFRAYGVVSYVASCDEEGQEGNVNYGDSEQDSVECRECDTAAVYLSDDEIGLRWPSSSELEHSDLATANDDSNEPDDDEPAVEGVKTITWGS